MVNGRFCGFGDAGYTAGTISASQTLGRLSPGATWPARTSFLLVTFGPLLLLSAFAWGQDTEFPRRDTPVWSDYFTEGHPKAKGFRVKIKYPSDWRIAEGERPSIVQKFVEKRSGGIMRMAALCVKELPPEVSGLPEKELQEAIRSGSKDDDFKEFLPPGANLTKGVVTAYDGIPGVLLIYTLQQDIAGLRFEIHNVQHMVFHYGRCLALVCAVGGSPGAERLATLFRESQPLFQMMGVHIILLDKSVTPQNLTVPPTKARVEDLGLEDIVLSILLTWLIGLTPPLLIRFVIVRRALQKGWTWALVVCFWFVNISIFVALGSLNKGHAVLLLVAWASYGILRAGAKQVGEF